MGVEALRAIPINCTFKYPILDLHPLILHNSAGKKPVGPTESQSPQNRRPTPLGAST